MADAGRVGYRTNGLSSALQLHHLSSHVGQTDGIALSGVQPRRNPMDHAIADSHPAVTISHSGIKEIRGHQIHQGVQYRTIRPYLGGRNPSQTPCPILPWGWAMGARPNVSA